MDKPKPQRLTRDQLASFLGTPELVRAFEAYIKWLAELTPDALAELQLSAANTAARIGALDEAAERDRQDAEAARVAALSAQVDQLREQIAAMRNEDLLSVVAALAELRERSQGMKIKRVIHDVITITTGNAQANYTISPSLSSTNALLIYNGSYNNAGAANGGAMRLTSTSNINYNVGVGVSTGLTGSFCLMEFEQ